MDTFSDKLRGVLSDPESMAKIAELAKSFSASSSPSEEEKGSPPPAVPPAPTASFGAFDLLKTPAIAEALRLLQNGSRERVALLQAMRPFVREEKKEKLDKIIQTMKTLDLISSAQKLI